MTGRAMALAVLAALGCGLPAASAEAFAEAAGVCGARAAIVAELARYGETRRSAGFEEGRGIVELWASERTGSWTILVTNADGRTCLMAAGEAFAPEIAEQADTPA